MDRAEALITRLRDIQSCRITTDETGQIAEVHVVACTNRSPKLIARDVESCLKAELGLYVDYRKIGVVIIDARKELHPRRRRTDWVEHEKTEPAEAVPHAVGEPEPRLEFLEQDMRVRFKGLSLTLGEGSFDIEIRLEKSGIEVLGSLGDQKLGQPILEIIAKTTVHALSELLDERFNLCLRSIEEVMVRGRTALLALVDVVEGRESQSYVGCAFIGRDQNEAAVLAVLDALNRPLGRWKSRREIHYTIR
jgi:hypothetical protein